MSEHLRLKELRVNYLNGNRWTKDQILTSLCLVHGYHRKSAIRLMYGELRRLMAQKPKKKRKPGVRSNYQHLGFKAALKAVWRETDYMCSKNLKRAMPAWLCQFRPFLNTNYAIRRRAAGTVQLPVITVRLN
jgi:hypothetical protein